MPDDRGLRSPLRVIDVDRVHPLARPDVDAIDDAGQVVGRMSGGNGSGWTPFIWQGGALYNLNKLIVGKPGIKIKKVRCINNKGWILCDAEKGDQSDAVILRPVNSPPASAEAARVVTRASP